MGAHPSITADTFPKQGPFLGCAVGVCFHYDTSRVFGGVIVRDDHAAPHQMIIRLDNGRHVLATECQYTLRDEAATSRRSKGSVEAMSPTAPEEPR